MIKISKKYLTKIIKEETAKVFEAHDEDSPSVTRPGEEDYTGHKGNKSKTHPGKDYMSDDDLMDYSKECPQGWKDADCMVNKINDLVKDSLESILTSAGELYGSIGDEQQEKIVSDLIFALEEPLLDLALEVGGSDEESDLMQEKDDDSFSKAGEEIEKKGTEGVFTKKAKDAGMGVQAFAKKVLAKDSDYSTKTKRQAAFAKGAETVAKNRKKKKK